MRYCLPKIVFRGKSMVVFPMSPCYTILCMCEKDRYRRSVTLKIVVLAGGLSPERHVSLVTGQNVCAALRER